MFTKRAAVDQGIMGKPRMFGQLPHLTRRLQDVFTPVNLFHLGEQGAWYDPTDLSTMFQDSAGTTPVTALEQPVGLMLDKSGRGNHLIQATSTKRPTYSARYNLLTQTEDFSAAAWATNNSIAKASGTAPDGTNTASKYQGNGSATTQYIYYTTQYNNKAGESLTASVYLKYGSRQYIQFFIGATGSDMFGCVVDVLNGSITATGIRAGGAYTSSSIQSAGSGWYKITITGSSTATNNGYFQIIATDVSTWTAGTPIIAANTLFTLLWGADLRRTIDTIGMPAYQRVGNGAAGSADYDSAGFFPYLSFDGTDDSAATAATVDFTGTDKMTVFSGVTKLSNNTSLILEHSSTVDTNNGTFAIGVAGGVNYFSGLRGTAVASYTETTFPAPITNILTSLYNVAGATIANEITPRINGVTPTLAASGTDAGTGNFGNYTLFLGARNNASLFFTGRMYPQIILGRAASAAEISATEQWLRQRMPVASF